MSTGLHKNLEIGEIHAPIAFEYADTAAREGATGLTSDDVRKFARQTDDNSIWMLTNHSPVTWVLVPAGSKVSSASATASTSTTSGTAVLMAGMTLTPGKGDYILVFNTSVLGTAASQFITLQVYVNGVAQAKTLRGNVIPIGSVGGFLGVSAYLTGVGASDAVEIRWATSAGTATAYARELILIKVG